MVLTLFQNWKKQTNDSELEEWDQKPLLPKEAAFDHTDNGFGFCPA
jgi:hypothetical protein